MDTFDPFIETQFPLVKNAGYKITSPEDVNYNCIAWAAGRNDIFINPHPDYFWPSNLPYSVRLSVFIKLYKAYGYTPCVDNSYEEGFEKIAIYVTENTDIVTHTARQLESGKWTSKLGEYKDIEHALEGLTKSSYGEVAVIMIRKKNNIRTHSV